MRTVTANISSSGGRKVNEDSFGGKQLDNGFGCWVVADGLGGHAGGEIASKIITETIMRNFKSIPSLSKESLVGLIDSAQAALIKQQEADLRHASMRSTVVIMLSDGHDVLWGHVGDSRLYHFRAGGIYFQTEDHSVPQAMVKAGDIGPEDIRHHEDRNRLLRTMGNQGKLRPSVASTAIPMQIGDAFLLCTDGFWEYVTEIEMGLSLAKSTSPNQWLELMERFILRNAPVGNDNYTGTAIFVEH